MSSTQLQKFKKYNQDVLDLLRKVHEGNEEPIRFTVPQAFDLQKLFDGWSDNRSGEASILFKRKIKVKKFFHQWEVLYKGTQS